MFSNQQALVGEKRLEQYRKMKQDEENARKQKEEEERRKREEEERKRREEEERRRREREEAERQRQVSLPPGLFAGLGCIHSYCRRKNGGDKKKRGGRDVKERKLSDGDKRKKRKELLQQLLPQLDPTLLPGELRAVLNLQQCLWHKER